MAKKKNKKGICPNCGSGNIENIEINWDPTYTEDRISQVCFCEDCHCEFEEAYDTKYAGSTIKNLNVNKEI